MDFLSGMSKEQIAGIIKLFNVQIAVVIALFCYLTKSIFAKFVLQLVNKFRKRNTKAKIKESKMYKPLQFMYVVLGIYFSILTLKLGPQVEATMTTFLKIIIIIFITKFLTTVVISKDSGMIKKLFTKSDNEAVNDFICKIINVIIWFTSGFIIFTELGYDLSGLITGLGLGTVLISLAAQDTVKSLLSGISILTDKPFMIGDWITVGTYAGTVVNITFRSTRIKCADNSVVTIPNSVITAEFVTNGSKMESRRFETILKFKMDETVDKLRKIMREMKMVLLNKDYIDGESIHIVLSNLADYSIDVKIILYIKETDYYKFLHCKEDIFCSLLKVMEKENIEMAFPTQDVNIISKVTPELDSKLSIKKEE